MPKKTSNTVETAPVAAATASSSTAAPSEKKVRAPKTVSAKANVAAAPAAKVEQPVAVAPVEQSTSSSAAVEAAAPESEAPLAEQSVEFLSKLQQLGAMISSLKAEYRVLEKKWIREVKVAQKLSSKRKRKAVNRAPSGFAKPTKISDELASFLGKEKGTEMARHTVTKDIHDYIRDHSLQDKNNGRIIIPDNKLAALLKLKKTDELTYFNLQRYMSQHFAKSVKAATTA